MSAANTLLAIQIANDLIGAIVNASDAANSVMATVKRAGQEGRDVSEEELEQARSRRVDVESKLQQALEKRRAADE